VAPRRSSRLHRNIEDMNEHMNEDMKPKPCSDRRILAPCSLEGIAYQIDPYVGCAHRCLYCYALNEAESDWEEQILVHGNMEDRLTRELEGVDPQRIYFGMNTDPYQPCEEEWRQTRLALEILEERGFSACLLTKSRLAARDLDLLARMPGSSLGVSLAFGDEKTRRLFEANAPPNEDRLEALRAAKRAGVRTYALICPVMPRITDVEALIEAAAPFADDVWVYALSMDSKDAPNWVNVRRILQEGFPELVPMYEEVAFRPEHPYWLELQRRLQELGARSRTNIIARL